MSHCEGIRKHYLINCPKQKAQRNPITTVEARGDLAHWTWDLRPQANYNRMRMGVWAGGPASHGTRSLATSVARCAGGAGGRLALPV